MAIVTQRIPGIAVWDGVFRGRGLYTWICFTYHFVKRTNGYKLFEDLNEPLSPKYNCVAVSDNYAEVMIEIQQSVDLIFVFNEANFLDNTLKLFEV